MNVEPFLSDVEDKESKNRNLFNRVFWGLFLVLLLVVAYWAGRSQAFVREDVAINDAYMLNAAAPHALGNGVDFGLFWDAWDTLRRLYVDNDDLDAQKLVYGAIDGMLAATGDPYTTFFDDEELAMFEEDLNGTFEGIGAEIGIRDELLTVVSPLEGSPAKAAGLRAGDVIVRIDDTMTNALSIDEAVNLIRGPRGTEVTLSIYREGATDTQDVVITRDEIILESVITDVIDGDTAYIQITRFGPDTAPAFALAAKEFSKDAGIKYLVLDVRNNPGGYLDSAVDMAGHMLPAGATVVMSEDQKGEHDIFTARGVANLLDLPTAVLINEGSASASEILAGALRDNRPDVTIVGHQSFGKGSVQELVPLTKGAMKVTIAKWLTPNGDQINEVGIAPGEEVDLTIEDFEMDRDPQKERALEVVRQ